MSVLLPARMTVRDDRAPKSTVRRAASAFVVPVVFAGMVSLQSPAEAATTSSSTGICSGVVNQLSHRGMVQENLLKAAA